MPALRHSRTRSRSGRRKSHHLLVPFLPGLTALGDNRSVAGEERAVALLRRVPLFAELEQSELERISRVAVPRTFPAGTRVFHEGDPSDACYIVRTGSFRVTREHPDGRAITLATFGEGDIFGELAMLDGEARS